MSSARRDAVLRAARRSPLASVLRRGRAAADSVLGVAGPPPLAADVHGVRLRGYLRHRAFLRRLAAGEYEAATRRLLERAIEPGACFVDGGAHIGYFTLLAARLVGPRGSVYAFEPDPYNFKALVYNVRRAGLANVTPVQSAISDQVGRSRFFASSGTIASSLVEKSYVKDASPVEVVTTSLDAAIEPPSKGALVLKLDLEGAEPRAIAGGRKLLRTSSRVLAVFEQNPTALADAGFDARASFDGFADAGLSVFGLDEETDALVPLDGASAARKGNFVAIRAMPDIA